MLPNFCREIHPLVVKKNHSHFYKILKIEIAAGSCFSIILISDLSDKPISRKSPDIRTSHALTLAVTFQSSASLVQTNFHHRHFPIACSCRLVSSKLLFSVHTSIYRTKIQVLYLPTAPLQGFFQLKSTNLHKILFKLFFIYLTSHNHQPHITTSFT